LRTKIYRHTVSPRQKAVWDWRTRLRC